MSTLLQMRSRIADDVLRSDIDTQINVAINRAIIYYESERFAFQETTGTFSTVANTQNYTTATIPTDIKEIDALRITISSSYKYLLKKTNYVDILSKDNGIYTSQPLEWAWQASSIWLYPTPNDAWVMTLSYQKSYAQLANDSDTNDWTVNAEDLIEARATWWINSRILKDQPAAAVAKQEELDALQALRRKSNKLKETGIIRATSF